MICDLAQTYHILDYKELPPSLVATLVFGLDNNSRIKRKISGCNLSMDELLLTLIFDGVNHLIWQRTKDGAKNRNRPESLFKKLTQDEKSQKDELETFKTVEDFKAWYQSKRT